MDFFKINQEFQNLQKKLEDSDKYIKGINNLIKRLDKEITKLEQKNETEKDNIQKIFNSLIINIKNDFKNRLEEIVNLKCLDNEKKE